MRTILKKTKKVDYNDFKMRRALASDVTELVKEPCTIVDEKGEIKLIYDIVPFDTTKYAEAIQRIKYQESTRVSGLKTVSRIFGYAPRVQARKDFCSSTSLLNDSPEEHDLIIEMGQKLSEVYLNRAPQVFAGHTKVADEKVRGEYRIEGTPFTSGIINKNNPLKYHFDSGNFKKVFSCMMAFKKDCEGGHLALPEYDIALEIADNSVLLFDGQDILHGVTPFKIGSDEGYRYTVVYYSLQRMWDCLSVTDEIARIRNRKTERERRRAGLTTEKDEPES